MGERIGPFVTDPTSLDAETEMSIRINWRAAGIVTLGQEGKLQFPRLPTEPGLYEFQFTGSTTSVYVGESDNLHRRMSHYRNPGPSQRTNIRLNDRIRRHLGVAEVKMAIATTVFAGWGSSDMERLDLSDKTSRVLGESVWVLHRQRQGHPIENAAAQ